MAHAFTLMPGATQRTNSGKNRFRDWFIDIFCGPNAGKDRQYWIETKQINCADCLYSAHGGITCWNPDLSTSKCKGHRNVEAYCNPAQQNKNRNCTFFRHRMTGKNY